MTDINVDELIAEVEQWMQDHSHSHSARRRDVKRLVAAVKQAERERDAALAVIERAKVVLQHGSAGDPTAKDQALRTLNSAPTEALRAVKAEAWDEGADEQFYTPDHLTNDREKNPYREETTRG